MKISHHAALGIVIALPASFYSVEGSLVILLSSVLIDLDHFLFYSIHEKKVLYPTLHNIKIYNNWGYFGPRVMLFHNYETVAVLALLSSVYGGLFPYLLIGMSTHLLGDQVLSYMEHRFLRIRTLIGDIVRYKEYLDARRNGAEIEYMVHRRDSWRGYIVEHLSSEHVEKEENSCGILKIYPEKPLCNSIDTSTWGRIF